MLSYVISCVNVVGLEMSTLSERISVVFGLLDADLVS